MQDLSSPVELNISSGSNSFFFLNYTQKLRKKKSVFAPKRMFLRCIFLDVFGVFAKNRNLRDDSAAFRHFWSHERRLMRSSGFVCAINLQVLLASLMFTFACLNDCKKCTACYLIWKKFIEKKNFRWSWKKKCISKNVPPQAGGISNESTETLISQKNKSCSFAPDPSGGWIFVLGVYCYLSAMSRKISSFMVARF